MIQQSELSKIKDIAEDFFDKMTIETLRIDAETLQQEGSEAVNLNVKLDEPQILIGQQGQTLFEIQRLLRMIANKKLDKVFYLNLDINNYKSQKADYLKDLAKSAADQVALTKKEKDLPPMLPYERRIVHAQLSQRADVLSESCGQGADRHIVVRPR